MKERIKKYYIDCPLGGDITNDCRNCYYSLDYHYVNGQCVRRDGQVLPMCVNFDNKSYSST